MQVTFWTRAFGDFVRQDLWEHFFSERLSHLTSIWCVKTHLLIMKRMSIVRKYPLIKPCKLIVPLLTNLLAQRKQRAIVIH